jgi:putative transposase
MQLVEKHIIKNKEYNDLCKKAKNLYNQSLYYFRQSIFGKIEYFNEYELTGLFAEFNEKSYKELPAQTAQQVIKLLFKNIKSWQKARKEYSKNPSKFLGRPKLPKYKKDYSIAIFTSQQVKLENGFIQFPKISNLPALKTKVDNICQVRVVPNSNHFTVEVVYKKQEKEVKPYNGNWMGIDLGMNNLSTCVTGVSAVIYSGKPLKAINHFYNRRKAKLQSDLPKNKFTTKRIERLTFRRNNKIENSLHQISNKIIKQAENESVTKIIIGNNKNWKQQINLGRNTNRNFVSIPHSTLIDKIKYKGLMNGIEVIITQEAYTSKCSALDLEPICKHENYAGKRIKRGLFKTANGFRINADCNGALNIARLVAGDDIILDSVRSLVSRPLKIAFFNKSVNIN